MNQTACSPRAAFDRWLADINSACGAFAAKPTQAGYRTHFEAFEHPGLHMSLLRTQGVELSRGLPEVRRDAREHYYAVFQLQGQAHIAQAGRQVSLRRGDLTLIDARQPCTLAYPETAEQISVLLPRHLLDAGPGAGAVQLPLLPSQQPVVGMALGLVRQVQDCSGQAFPASQGVADALAALIRGLLRDTWAAPPAPSKGYGKALAYIEQHLEDDALTPERIAGHLGISVRGLYRLFGDHGQVVARFIRQRRLEQCARQLRESPAVKLSALAYGYGFSDASYFAAAFKAQFGLTPSAYRARYAQGER